MTSEPSPLPGSIVVGTAERTGDRSPSACPLRSPWIRRLGVLGFLFFFIKGLAWLLVPAVLAWWAARD